MENYSIFSSGNSPRKRKLLSAIPVTLSLFIAASATSMASASVTPGITKTATVNASNVTGVVVDASGVPLIGVNVLEKGTTNGTITDFDGKFTLNVSSPNAKLVISYIGYVSQEVSAPKNGELKVVLKEDTETLEEVVVVGYGTQKKANLSGSVSSVDSEQLQNRPIQNVSRDYKD